MEALVLNGFAGQQRPLCHWNDSARSLWLKLCQEMDLRGNDCNDALLAAVCIDRGLRLVSFDHGFQRFGDLRLLLLK